MSGTADRRDRTKEKSAARRSAAPEHKKERGEGTADARATQYTEQAQPHCKSPDEARQPSSPSRRNRTASHLMYQAARGPPREHEAQRRGKEKGAHPRGLAWRRGGGPTKGEAPKDGGAKEKTAKRDGGAKKGGGPKGLA